MVVKAASLWAEKITTDGLGSYGAAMRELGVADRREVGRYANNRAENSHQPFRRRERAMLRFQQMKTLQKFSSVHAAFHNHFNQERHLVSRIEYKARRLNALAEWQHVAESAETSCLSYGNQKLVEVGLTAPAGHTHYPARRLNGKTGKNMGDDCSAG